MKYGLTDAQREFQARFDAVCRERIAPRAREADRSGEVPRESWRDLVDSGFLRLFHGPEHGGLGADGVTQGLAMESLARACASTFWTVSISAVLAGKMLSELCGPSHHKEWLAPILAGDKIGAFAATEDGAGSDPASYRTTLRRTSDGLRLRGGKSRISNACTADVAVVLARRDEPTGPTLCYVVVDLCKRGVLRRELPKLGLQGMSWGTIGFDDVEIAAEDVIVGASIEKTLQVVEWGQLMQAWCGIGVAQAAFEAAQAHAQTRSAFGRPLAHLEIVHGRLADMQVAIDAARLLTLEVSWLKGRGRAARELVLLAKIEATEMAVRVADQAMRNFGGWGFSKQHPVERYYRDSLANVPAGLPTDRLRELIACAMVEVDPWAYEPFDWLDAAGLRLGAV